MLIKKLILKNFRCFSAIDIPFDGRCIVLQGKNGSGKSSILEALHYSCYLRSFRTHVHKNLIKMESDNFFLHVDVEQQLLGVNDTISVGVSTDANKLVKLNGKQIQSYKELVSSYRIVTLSADDLVLIHGAPEERRVFLNYALFLFDPPFLINFKRYRQILENRNSILFRLRNYNSLENKEELEVWSKKLWDESQIIRIARIEYLLNLEKQVNTLLHSYFSKTDADLVVAFEYIDKINYKNCTFDQFWPLFYSTYFSAEQKNGRSLFGVHLDDFSIIFQQKKARIFASRGQQKLIVFLIKVAQLLELGLHSEPGVLLLDDFLTDFDDQRIQECFSALCNLPFQVILTCPTNTSLLKSGLLLSDKIGGFSIVSL